MTAPASTLSTPIEDISVPYTDEWWFHLLLVQLRDQQRKCQTLQNRYEGNSPLPMISTQREAVRLFVEKSRTNWERLIVTSVLSRMAIVGLRTALGSGDAGDPVAFRTWKTARMKLAVLDALKMRLAMSRAYILVGRTVDGEPLVTAEDPRLVTAIVDPTDPFRTLAGLKVYHDSVANQDVAYLYLPGRVAVAKNNRKARLGSDVSYNATAYLWDRDIIDSVSGDTLKEGLSGPIDGLATYDDEGKFTGGGLPLFEFINEDHMAEFEPFLSHIDRINQQILQRMTIATIQAFKQRAFKGLPKTDPDTGEPIDYDALFVADPGAVWNIPASVEIWESGQVDLSGILLAIRDDVKDLAAVSSTPLYTVTPDAASNGSAAGASLQREQHTFKVSTHRDRVEPGLENVAELLFRMLGDADRAKPGSVEIIWAPIESFSMAERGSAVAQTKGVLSRYTQATEIWGLTPDQASRNSSELTDDLIIDQQYAAGLAAATSASVPAQPPVGQPQPQAGAGFTQRQNDVDLGLFGT